MRCRYPDCEAEAWWPGIMKARPTWIRCREHRALDDDDDMILCWAQEYAVACIVYYATFAGGPTMPDWEFDDLCKALLTRRAWGFVSWLEERMLTAGSGYDLAKFPADLHEAAEAWRNPQPEKYPSSPEAG